MYLFDQVNALYQEIFYFIYEKKIVHLNILDIEITATDCRPIGVFCCADFYVDARRNCVRLLLKVSGYALRYQYSLDVAHIKTGYGGDRVYFQRYSLAEHSC